MRKGRGRGVWREEREEGLYEKRERKVRKRRGRAGP